MVLLANFNECHSCAIDEHSLCDGPEWGCECNVCYPDEYAQSLVWSTLQ